MENTISAGSLEMIKKMQQNELTESVIYEKIAAFAKGDVNRETMKRMAAEERGHYETWKKYTGIEMKPQRARVMKYVFLAKVFGFTFAVKLMERGEQFAQEQYEALAAEVPESVRIRADEEEHEHALLEMLDEERLKYVGSMVLGLNDALVELAGSLAGFTFALMNTGLVALSGLIVGISATFSMASSEFLSAKNEGRDDALKSCSYTGIAYLITVILLILPYTLLSEPLIALFCMLGIIVVIITAFTYYISVATDQKFLPRFLEMLLISLGVAAISFVVGIIAKQLLGVDI